MPTQLHWPEVADRLAQPRNYWLHTTRPSGAPDASPVWAVVVDRRVYFYSERSTLKARNIEHDPRVVLHLESGDDVVIVRGRAVDVGRPSAHPAVLEAFENKYVQEDDLPYLPSADPEFDVLYELRPDRALLWSLPDSESSMRRWVVGDQFHFHPDTYFEMVRREVPLYPELQRQAADATQGVDVRSVLDLGAGTGETSAAVLKRHPEAALTGVDESAPMLAEACRRIPGADYRLQRLEDPLPDGPFDLVVSALAVHHLDGPSKLDLFHRVAARLRPGGRFVLADVVVPEHPAGATTPIEDAHDKPSTVAEQLRWLEEAGFSPEVRWAAGDLAVIAADRLEPQP